MMKEQKNISVVEIMKEIKKSSMQVEEKSVSNTPLFSPKLYPSSKKFGFLINTFKKITFKIFNWYFKPYFQQQFDINNKMMKSIEDLSIEIRKLNSTLKINNPEEKNEK